MTDSPVERPQPGAADKRPYLLEVCVDRLGDAIAAVEAGADRLELCGCLEVGGLTPSAGLLREVLDATDAQVVAMIRPRAGGFCYDDHDLQVAQREATEALAAGATGIVFGALRSDGVIDRDATGRMVQAAGPAEFVFHRAFDFAPDASAALETLVDLGVTRLLTSGGKPTAPQGVARLQALCEQARGRIQIMPGSGVRPENILRLVHATGCRQIHVGASLARTDNSLDLFPDIPMRSAAAYDNGAYRAVDAAAVRHAAEILRTAGVDSHPAPRTP